MNDVIKSAFHDVPTLVWWLVALAFGVGYFTGMGVIVWALHRDAMARRRGFDGALTDEKADEVIRKLQAS